MFYRDELARRDHADASREMLRLTRWVAVMTLAILVLTIINVIVVART